MRILVFGDSIAQGFHDELWGGWCSRLINDVMKREVESDYEYNKSVVNLGISGDTTEDVLKRIKSEVEARVLKYPTSDYDVLLLAIGVNDSQFIMDTRKNKIPVETTIGNIEKIVTEVSEYCKKVVLVGVAPVWDDRIQPMAWKQTHGYGNDHIAKYNRALKALSAKNNYLFIDMDNVYEDADNECLPDGIHPNAKGHELIFKKVKSVLEADNLL